MVSWQRKALAAVSKAGVGRKSRLMVWGADLRFLNPEAQWAQQYKTQRGLSNLFDLEDPIPLGLS